MQTITQKITPFTDQKPGTSGLRKPTVHWQQEHYTESFIQAIFNVLGVAGKTIVIGGDGRYHNDKAIQIIIKMAVAQKAAKLIVAEGGLLTTPAASHLIRFNKADFGIILSASHNPGGKSGDFGIKFNLDAGQPAPESVTEAVFAASKELESYTICETEHLPPLRVGFYDIEDTKMEVVSSTVDYADLMEELFDFDKLREFLKTRPLIFDAMHAATGPYALEIFGKRLGLDEKYLINTIPLPDFGAGHPDPQPSYAKDLNAALEQYPEAVLGAASDGDGDRNMVTGQKFFINPCDSLAVIAANSAHIPCLQELKGIGRTMPTSRAIDAVAKQKGFNCYQTPTGWKFFGNLLNADKIQLCGEESFGTSGNHIREKDGIWAVLCWLSILAAENKTPAEIMEKHWQTYGRHHFNRFDYEGLDKEAAEKMITAFAEDMSHRIGSRFDNLTLTHAAQFDYTDPTNGETSRNQGLEIQFGEQARIICRLSGTDTRGATLRMYCEYWQQIGEHEPHLPSTSPTQALATIAHNAMNITERFNMSQPSNIV